MRQTFFPETKRIQGINGFTKLDVDLINKYCAMYGYKPDFKNKVIHDATKCHKVSIFKMDGAIYARDYDNDIMERLSDNMYFSQRLGKAMRKANCDKFYNKYLSDAFGLVSLKHSGEML